MTHPLEGLTLSLSEAASAFNLSPRRVQQLTKDGHVPKPERGRYPFLPLLHGYLRVIKDEGRAAARSADDELKQIRIERERVKLAAEVRDIVMVEDALFYIDQLCGLVNLNVNNIPARFTRDLETRDRLQEHVDEALTRVAAGVQKCGDALRARCGDDPSADEDPAED